MHTHIYTLVLGGKELRTMSTSLTSPFTGIVTCMKIVFALPTSVTNILVTNIFVLTNILVYE